MMYGPSKWILIGVVWWLSTTLFAATAPFLPDRGTVMPDTWDTGFFAGIFQNPSRVSSRFNRFAIRVDGSQDVYDVQQLSIATAWSGDGFGYGIGYLRYGTQNLKKTTRSAATSRVVEDSGYSDLIQQVSMVGAVPLSREFQIGINSDYVLKTIDGISAYQVAAGIGFRWQQTPDVWINGYWRRLVQTSLRWSDAVTESTVGLPYVGIEYRPNWCDGFLNASVESLSGAIEIPITVELSLYGAGAIGAINRYSLGTVLKLGDYGIHYVHTIYPDSVLNATQEMIGVVLNFDYVTQ